MGHLEDTSNEEKETNFENEEMPFILSGLADREKELEDKKESGEICDLDDPENCESCSG